MVKVASKEFVNWINKEIEERGWSLREAARRAGISHTIISNAMSGDQPSFETCIALAKALDYPVVMVLSLAKLIDVADIKSLQLEEWVYLFEKLPLEDQEELIEIARIKLKKANRKE